MASKHKKAPSLEVGKSGEEIRFAVGETSLGLILVASSAKGLPHLALNVGAPDVQREIETEGRRLGEIEHAL